MSDRVIALGSVALGVASIARTLPFYENEWGLEQVKRTADTAYLRAAGPEPFVLSLQEGAGTGLIAVRFRCASRAALEALHSSLAVTPGVRDITPIEPKDAPGGGVGFAFRDPEGRRIRLAAEVALAATKEGIADRPWKLAHVVLNAVDPDASAAFFMDRLGFRLSDQTGMMHFLRCNADHHAVAFAKTGNTSLNHVAFEIPSWDGLMRGAGRVKSAGHRLHWGLGRHGPGANVFAYFLDPDGYAVEYTAEVQQIDEATHKVGRPADWHRPGNLDQWNFADPPSEALRHAMHGGH